ncbi:MAG: hypothetical protein AB1351_13005 [Thermoproteota archaeon]
MRRRKQVLLVDYNSSTSQEAIESLKGRNIEFVEYDVAKFETSCCGELPTTILLLSLLRKESCDMLQSRGAMARSSQKAPTGRLVCQRPKAFKNWPADIAVRSYWRRAFAT